MAKNEKKVSITSFDKIAKEHFQNEKLIQWYGVDVRVKRTLPITDMLAFVDDVVTSCFHDKLGFMPEVKDFLIKSNILTRYANFAMPDNLERRYQMIYGTDAVDAVCAAIDPTQLQEIVNAINSKIRFLCDSKATLIQQRINDVLDVMEEMRNNTRDIFDGLSQDDLKNLVNAISKNGLDEQKLVRAILKQSEENSEPETGGNDNVIVMEPSKA